jgi:hypothetical protein
MAAAGLMLCSASAFAQGTPGVYYADPGYANGSAILNVQVSASVGGRCGFDASGVPTGTYDQRNFDVTGFTHNVAFKLDCTGPSRVAVVSTNGGLKTGGTVPAGYATLAPYNVTLDLDGVGGSNPDATQTCAVANLSASAASPCTFRGPASTTVGLRLALPATAAQTSYLRAVAPIYNPAANGGNFLVAGEYQDILTVTVSVAP